MTNPRKTRDPKTLRAATQLVHGGSMRSSFEETSEALFLTQGYLYDTMEQAEARFKGDDPGFVYSRYGNPTVAMFEERMALLEGAEAARAPPVTPPGRAAPVDEPLSRRWERRPRLPARRSETARRCLRRTTSRRSGRRPIPPTTGPIRQ